MVKFGIDRFDPIMAANAIRPISLDMRCGEGRIPFSMAVGACDLVKRCVIPIMAINAGGIRMGGE
jgi:hypothetical protein